MRKIFRFLSSVALVTAGIGSGAIPAQADGILSRQGGVCIDAEGGVREAARLLGYPCHGGANQQFEFVNAPNTRLRVVGTDLCATSDSQAQGSEIRLRPCDWSDAANALQNFAPWTEDAIGHNSGYVMDLSGGWAGQILTMFPGVLQPIVLWSSHLGDNQRWYSATMNAYASVSEVPSGETFVVPGVKGLFRNENGAIRELTTGGLINLEGGNLISDRTQGLIAAGGLN
jgi:hypothetical protein